MAAILPTKVGDVLILRTTRNYTVHVIGAVTRPGQPDFRGANGLIQEHNYSAAIAQATALVGVGGRVVLSDIDTNEWSIVRG